MGESHALGLASRGADIVNHSSPEAAESVVKAIEAMGRKAIAMKADISQPQSIAKLFSAAHEHFKHIDIVISNSGVESFSHISEITPEEFDRVFSINTRGQLFVAYQAYKYLTPGGRLVMLSSISALAKTIKIMYCIQGQRLPWKPL